MYISMLKEVIPNRELVQQDPELQLFTMRVNELESTLGAGSYEHAPLHFMAGLEVEFLIHEDLLVSDFVETLNDPSKRRTLKEKKVLTTDTPTRFISAAERYEMIMKAQQDAVHLVAALQPQTPQEHVRQKRWLQEAKEFGIREVINFRLYERFSTPTLSRTDVPENANYTEMVRYGQEQGWLEFRFGKGIFQSGYYDNAGIAELRFTPCSPSELVYRRKIVQEHMARLAAEYGTFTMEAGKHLNISVYKENEQGEYQSIIGRKKGREVATLDAGAGLSQALEDGAWFNATSAEQPKYYHSLPFNFNISGGRDAVRVKESYFELRAPELTDSPEQGLLFAMASISVGLEQGWGRISEKGHETPLVKDTLKARPTEGYQKERDLYILRALQNSTLGEEGTLVLDSNYNKSIHQQLAQALGISNGGMNKQYNMAMNTLAINGLMLQSDGTLRVSSERMQDVYNKIKNNDESALALTDMQLKEFAGRVNQRVGAVKFRTQRTIEAEPYYAGINPVASTGRLLNSAVFHRMYGDLAERYAFLLEDIALPKYKATSYEQIIKGIIAQALRPNSM